jgi:hypothetical protein
LIQKQKTEKETEKNKTIPKLVLNNFLENIDTEIPNDLLPYITIVDYNTIMKIYKISYCKLTDSENKIIIFTKNIQYIDFQQQLRLELEYNKENNKLIISEKIKGNKDYVDNKLLSFIQNKNLNKNKTLQFISNTRRIPIKENSYINLDTREVIESSLIFEDQEKYKTESVKFDKLKTALLFQLDIESGLIIDYLNGADIEIPTLQLKFNLFDKIDVVFKELQKNINYDDLSIAIKHLQTIIPNSDALIFLANQIAWHYFNPFDTQHRRINMILCGGQGTGKTSITDIICNLFNSKTNNYSYNKFDNFNVELKGEAVIIFNEYKKKGDSVDLIKRYFESENYLYNDKYAKKIRYPVYAISICSLNVDLAKNRIENLIEEQDNRNYVIEMEVRGVVNTFSYLKNKNNYSIIQTAIIIIALQYRMSINDMEKTIRERTQIMNLEKINFTNFWDYIKNELEKQKNIQINIHNDSDYGIAIQKKLFKKYFLNQKEYLLKKDINFNHILELKITPQLKAGSVVKTIIKENENLLISESIKNSRDNYIITKKLINNINENALYEDAYNNTKININKIDFKELKYKIEKYLIERNKNFINVYDK